MWLYLQLWKEDSPEALMAVIDEFIYLFINTILSEIWDEIDKYNRDIKVIAVALHTMFLSDFFISGVGGFQLFLWNGPPYCKGLLWLYAQL